MAELFVEIGTEELPAGSIAAAVDALATGLEKLLGPLSTAPALRFSTPRRLAVALPAVLPRRPVVERVVTGPAAAIAMKDGQATPAGVAFAAKQGLPPESLLVVDGPKGPVVAVKKLEGGEATADRVAAGLDEVLRAIPWKRSMRWGPATRAGSPAVRFARPIHWVTAVLDGEPVGGMAMGLLTSGESRGHWLWAPEAFPVRSAAEWNAELRKRHVVADLGERRGLMLRRLEEAAEKLGAELRLDEALVEEVVQLVETPHVVVGRFDAALLDLPPRLLIESMKVHQRYFPTFVGGRLSNHFLVVSNNPFGDATLIAEGNARVLHARFHDAKFFYAEDRRIPLAEHGRRLAGMVWIRGLGSMAERQRRVREAGLLLAPATGADPARVDAAGALCKCDLTTTMVGEFPELQGHVGRLLAELEGVPGALAIEEHYLPRFAGDRLPTTPEGRALALAERATLLLDTAAAGLLPKGSADPLGLRRAANGLVSLVLAARIEGDLRDLLEGLRGARTPTELGADHGPVVDFVLARLKASLLAEGHPTDLVEAVYATGGADLVHIADRVRAMGAMVRDGSFAPVRVAFRRAAGLVKEVDEAGFDRARFQAPVEHELADALAGLPPATDVGASLAALTALRPVVDRYFDGVLVMCDDPELRAARLGLLAAVTRRFANLADFTRLSTE